MYVRHLFVYVNAGFMRYSCVDYSCSCSGSKGHFENVL